MLYILRLNNELLDRRYVILTKQFVGRLIWCLCSIIFLIIHLGELSSTLFDGLLRKDR